MDVSEMMDEAVSFHQKVMLNRLVQARLTQITKMNQFEVTSSSNSEQEEQQLSKMIFYNDDAELPVFPV